jgi:predicted membrane-bound spermidine synthase
MTSQGEVSRKGNSGSFLSEPLTWLVLLSGACALAYQVVWMRELSLIFGATTKASATVLAVFMAGLGIGSYFVGRFVDRLANPWRWYSLFEAGIALAAGFSPLLVQLNRAIYLQSGGEEALGYLSSTVLRIALAGIIFGVPTVLMGGTLPLAVRIVARRLQRGRAEVGFLYGMNTLGALVGSLLTTFVLLEHFGNRRVLIAAAVCNGICAAVAWRQGTRTNYEPQFTENAPTKTGSENGFSGPLHSSTVKIPAFETYLTAFVVGSVFFLMELTWYRMLGPLLGGNTYTFGLIIATVLLGIGSGGVLYARVSRLAAISQLGLAGFVLMEAICIAIPLWLGDSIAEIVFKQQLQGSSSFAEQVFHWAVITGVVVLPTSLVAGIQFPYMIALVGQGATQVGSHVGRVSAANTTGAIVGALMGGFWLIPLLTAVGTWRVAVVVLLVLSGWLIVEDAIRRCLQSDKLQRRSLFAKILSVGVFAIVPAVGMITWKVEGPTAFWRHSGIGAGRARNLPDTPVAMEEFKRARKRQVLWESEGVESSIAVTATNGLAFLVNGKSDGNCLEDAATQVGLAVLGTVLHPDPQKCLVVGLGTGETAGWLADMTPVKNVDVVELEPDIIQVAQLCRLVNRECLTNEKVRIYSNDAREHLLTVNHAFDLVLSVPSNPYRAGVANLFTEQFYQGVANRLKERGLFLQWLQAYEVDAETVATVVKTVRSVFPHCQLWRTKSWDLVLIGSRQPIATELTSEALQARLADTAIREAIEKVWFVNDAAGVLAHYVCEGSDVEEFLRDIEAPRNTDDWNRLEFGFAKTVGRNVQFEIEPLYHLADQREIRQQWYRDLADPEEIRSWRLALQQSWKGGGDVDYQLSQGANALQMLHAVQHQLMTGKELDLRIIAEVERMRPVDAIALRAIHAWQLHESASDGESAQKHREAAAEESKRVIETLRVSAWFDKQIMSYWLKEVVVGIASFDSAKGTDLFYALEQPFAVYGLDIWRHSARIDMSRSLGSDCFVAAIAPLEPNVPLDHVLLEQRERHYRELRHPFTKQATADLRQFLQMQELSW